MICSQSVNMGIIGKERRGERENTLLFPFPNFQAAVRAQVEEKERQKRLEREKKLQEDLEEERKLQAERDMLKTQFELEQQKTRQKEVGV